VRWAASVLMAELVARAAQSAYPCILLKGAAGAAGWEEWRGAAGVGEEGELQGAGGGVQLSAAAPQLQ
jgi:hypothetical protein